MPPTTSFDVSAETRATKYHFLYRQLLRSAPAVSPSDADLSGNTAIVTGANSGLGMQVARQLLSLGATVILAVRDQARGEEAKKELTRALDGGGSPKIDVWQLDLQSYESITMFSKRAKDLPSSLDIVVLNAGVFKVDESFDKATGYEQDVQVNYLSNILMLLLLLPLLKEKRSDPTKPGTLVLLSSDLAAMTKFQERARSPLLPSFKEPFKGKWDMADRYGTSKLLGQLFLARLAENVPSSSVVITCANPGLCYGSNLNRDATGFTKLSSVMGFRLLGHSCTVGANTVVRAATVLGTTAHGQYVEDGKIQPMAPLVYSAEGRQVANRLYEETMGEFASQNVRDVVTRLQ